MMYSFPLLNHYNAERLYEMSCPAPRHEHPTKRKEGTPSTKGADVSPREEKPGLLSKKEVQVCPELRQASETSAAPNCGAQTNGVISPGRMTT